MHNGRSGRPDATGNRARGPGQRTPGSPPAGRREGYALAVAKSPDDMMSAVTGSLAARTGRSLDEWLELVQASGIDPLDQNAVRRWLKAEHGVPQNSQWAIADAAARAAGWV